VCVRERERAKERERERVCVCVREKESLRETHRPVQVRRTGGKEVDHVIDRWIAD